MRNDFKINSFQELDLYGYTWKKVPEENAKAVIVLVHGMAEHIERYDAFANFLADNGFYIYAINQRGHGPKAEMQGYLGENGWYKMKEDLKKVIETAKAENPSKPIFVFGHSMGSFVTRNFLIENSSLVDAVILSGTGFAPKFLIKAGKWLSGRDVKKYGVKHLSKKIDNIAFGSYTNKIDKPKTSFDWLSRDAEQVAKYINDPYSGNMHPSSFFNDFFNGLLELLYHPEYKNIKKGLPVYLISGDQDPVGSYGQGVIKAAEAYEEIGFKVFKKLYSGGRHEMLNETNRNEVFNDVLSFFNSQIE